MIASLLLNVYTFLGWLLHSTCQASLLICLVLSTQWALRRRISVRARHCLWLLVVVRLALPWAPQSHVSLYNLLPDAPRKGYEAALGAEKEPTPTFSAERDEIYAARPLHASGSVAYDPGKNAYLSDSQARVFGSPDRFLVWLALIWLAGAGALGTCILAGNVRVWYRLRRLAPVTDPVVLALLSDCQKLMRTHSPIRVVVTDQVSGPALFGLVRPRLLLPEGALTDTDLGQLRYIFLHELAHLKRHDILVGALASVLHVLHWFNPLVAYAFQRMRADRELACDGLALSVLEPHETSAYGHTVVRQIERLLLSRPRPVLATFMGEQAWAKRRVSMISRFRREEYRWSPLALALVGALVCVGLTDARVIAPSARAEPVVVQPTDRYETPEALAPMPASTKRIYIRHHQLNKYLVADGTAVTYAAEPGEAGLWEAQYDGEFTPDGEMLIYSVSQGRYLSADAQGGLSVAQRVPDKWARWFRSAGPLGVQVVSQGLAGAYLRLEENGQPRVAFAKDAPSQWDIMQLE